MSSEERSWSHHEIMRRATRVRLEKSGADLFQFDSSKRKAKAR